MPNKTTSTIAFDVLLRGETDDMDVATANLDKLRPPPEAIEKCFRWFAAKGVTCFRTDFGLGCEATVELFQSLFDVKLKQIGAEQPHYQIDGELHISKEIADLISQVTLVRPPTFFG